MRGENEMSKIGTQERERERERNGIKVLSKGKSEVTFFTLSKTKASSYGKGQKKKEKKTQQQNTYKSTQSKHNPHKFWLLLHSSFSHTQQIFNLKTQLSSASAQILSFLSKEK